MGHLGRASPPPVTLADPAEHVVATNQKVVVPRASTGAIPRDRCDTALTQAIADHRVVLVVAPAGYRKTTMVTDWARQRAAPTAWLSLDAGDNDQARLAAALAQALAHAGVDVDSARTWEGIDRVLSALSTSPPGLVLVVDDVQELNAAAMRLILSPLVRFAPDAVRLVLVGRFDPAGIPVNKLRTHGELGEVRRSDLAFTGAEITALARAERLRVEGALAEELRTLTDGWAVAVRLALLSLQPDHDVATQIRLLRHLDVDVNEYLVQEVLGHLDPPLTDFVLDATVCDEITPGLAEELVADGARRLEECLARGLFLSGPTRPADEPSYRWNPLFAAHCRAVATRRSPRRPERVHLTAARYLQRRDPEAAFGHALLGADFALAVQIIADVWPDLVVLGSSGRLRAMCRQLPPPYDEDEEIRFALAAADALDGASDLAADTDPVVGDARRSAALGKAERRQLVSSLIRILVARSADGMRERTAQVAALLPQLTAATPALRAFGLYLAGRAEVHLGCRGRYAMDLLDEAARIAARCGLHGIEIACRAETSLALLVLGDLLEADRMAATTISRAAGRTWQRSPAVSTAHLVRGVVAFWQDRLADAKAQLSDAAVIAGGGYAEVGSYAVLALARAQLAAGDVASARRSQAREEVLRATGELSPYVEDYKAFVLGATLQAEGNLTGALAVARSATAYRHPSRLLWQASILRSCGDREGARAALARLPGEPCAGVVPVGAGITDALIKADEGEIGAAHACLEQALGAAERARIHRPFREQMSLLRPLLVEHLGWGTSHTDLIRDVLRVHEESAHPVPAGSVLTGRESEVLQCLRSSMSTAEIAASLFLSVNTVKTHQRAIYRKLAVEGRREAVRKGLDVGLI